MALLTAIATLSFLDISPINRILSVLFKLTTEVDILCKIKSAHHLKIKKRKNIKGLLT